MTATASKYKGAVEKSTFFLTHSSMDTNNQISNACVLQHVPDNGMNCAKSSPSSQVLHQTLMKVETMKKNTEIRKDRTKSQKPVQSKQSNKSSTDVLEEDIFKKMVQSGKFEANLSSLLSSLLNSDSGIGMQQSSNPHSEFTIEEFLASVNEFESISEAEEMLWLHQSTSLLNSMEGWNVLGLHNLKPKLVVNYKSGTKIEPMDEIISRVYERVLLTVEDDIDGELTEYPTIFENSHTTVLFSNLVEVALNEQDSKKWSVELTHLGDQLEKQFIELVFSTGTPTTRELAEQGIVESITRLIFKESKAFPERCIQNRIFRFQGIITLMPASLYSMLTTMSTVKSKNRATLEELDASFQELKHEFGSDFRAADLNMLSYGQVSRLFGVIMQAQELGQREWPFKNTTSK